MLRCLLPLTLLGAVVAAEGSATAPRLSPEALRLAQLRLAEIAAEMSVSAPVTGDPYFDEARVLFEATELLHARAVRELDAGELQTAGATFVEATRRLARIDEAQALRLGQPLRRLDRDMALLARRLLASGIFNDPEAASATAGTPGAP